MPNPEYLNTLIDKASERATSDYKLAKMLGVARQTVSHWRHNRKTCPVADQTLMASIAGLDAQAWAARAIVAQYEGTAKGDQLYKALGKSLLATGGVIVSSGASARQIFSLDSHRIATAVVDFIRCILC